MDSSGQEARDVLTEILRHGAQQMLATAIESEVAEYIDAHTHQRDDQGGRMVVRNGRMPPRSILTGLGSVEVKRPRVNDRRVDEAGQWFRWRFTTSLLSIGFTCRRRIRLRVRSRRYGCGIGGGRARVAGQRA